MTNKKFKVQLAHPERYFSKNYHDFMDSTLLNGEEKIIFLALKRFLDVKSDNGNVFPTIDKIQEMTSWGNQKVIKYIKSLVKKGVVKSVRQGLNKPNIYIIADNAEMWKAKNIETLQKAATETEIEKAIKIVQNAGYEIIAKRKEPVSTPTKDQTQDPNKKSLFNNDNTPSPEKSQVERYTNDNTAPPEKSQVERYTMEEIRKRYDYYIYMLYNPMLRTDIDIVFDVLYDALNTTKETLRVNKEDKPAMVVISKLLKLDMEDILYVIRQYNQQTVRIKNVKSYLLSMLYNAKEQHHLDINNLVQHNMYGTPEQLSNDTTTDVKPMVEEQSLRPPSNDTEKL